MRVTCHIIGVQKGELSPKDCSFHWLRRFPLHAIGERWVQARQEIWVVDGRYDRSEGRGDSDILLYDDTQWVAYMSAEAKSRTALG